MTQNRALPELLLVALGGTITMTPAAAGAGIAPTLTGADLIAAVPALAGIADIRALSPRRLPSASLGLADIAEAAGLIEKAFAGSAAGAILVQGTDTIEETAFLLDLLIDSDRPIVVTGAMRGADQPGADGPANLLAAAVTATSPNACGLGTLVVLGDAVHAARFVQKSSTFLPSAFTSPGMGPLGHIVEGEAKIAMRVARRPAVPGLDACRAAPVALHVIAMGEDGRALAALADLGYRGVVIEAMGAGHVPAEIVPVIAELAGKIPVVLSSRIASGPVLQRTYGYAGSEIDLLGRGLIAGGALGGLKSRLLLSLLIGAGLEGGALRAAFAAHG